MLALPEWLLAPVRVGQRWINSGQPASQLACLCLKQTATRCHCRGRAHPVTQKMIAPFQLRLSRGSGVPKLSAALVRAAFHYYYYYYYYYNGSSLGLDRFERFEGNRRKLQRTEWLPEL